MSLLSPTERDKYLREHLRHRLTLLRTLRERNRTQFNYKGCGDVYRCVKDSNLIAVRLLMDFLGLKGKFNGNEFELISGTSSRFADDVKIDRFIGKLLVPGDVPPAARSVLAGVYVRADKELAHLTTQFSEEFNQEEVLIEAATVLERLLEIFLYRPLGEPLPEIDK